MPQDSTQASTKADHMKSDPLTGWRLTALVVRDEEAPATGGARFKEFDKAFWLESGALAFWSRAASSDKSKGDWGFFSLKNGRLTSVLSEKGDVTPPASEKITEKLKASHTSIFQDSIPVQANKRLVYVTIKAGFLSRHKSVYGWDGEQMRKVLVSGDDLQVGGEHYTIHSAEVIAVGPADHALIEYHVKQPYKTAGWALHDGDTIKPLWKQGEELPGAEAMRLNEIAWHPKFYTGQAGCPPALFKDGILALARVGESLDDKAIVCLMPGQAKKIAAIGDAYPLTSEEFTDGVITDLGSFTAASPDVVVFQAGVILNEKHSTLLGREKIVKMGGQRFLLYDHGSYFIAFAPPALRQLTIGKDAFLPTEDTNYLFEQNLNWTTKEVGSNTIYNHHRADVCLLNSERLIELTEGMPLDTVLSLRVFTESFMGAVIEGKRLVPDSKGNLEAAKEVSRWFLDARAPEKGLQPSPELKTVDDRSVNLCDVITWKRPNEAIVQLSDGFYLLSR